MSGVDTPSHRRKTARIVVKETAVAAPLEERPMFRIMKRPTIQLGKQAAEGTFVWVALEWYIFV